MRFLFSFLFYVIVSSLGFSDEVSGTLKNAHGGVENLTRHLSQAFEGLSHGLGGPSTNRPISNEDIDEKSVLNGLKQLSQDPALDPNETFDSLKKQEAALRQELANGEKQDSVREKHQEVHRKIKNQIEQVMKKAGYEPMGQASTTYKRRDSMLSVRYTEGEIKIDPIKLLPSP